MINEPKQAKYRFSVPTGVLFIVLFIAMWYVAVSQFFASGSALKIALCVLAAIGLAYPATYAYVDGRNRWFERKR